MNIMKAPTNTICPKNTTDILYPNFETNNPTGILTTAATIVGIENNLPALTESY
jgi:hypothetical protein